MMDGLNSIKMQAVVKNVPQRNPRTLIDNKSIKGILFLGVKGDLSNILETNDKINIFV